MASILQTLDKLMAATGHGTLAEFVHKGVDRGDDAAEIRISIYKAVGLEYDRRTVARWMQTYGS